MVMRNFFWIIILAMLGIAMLWLGGKSSYRLYQYVWVYRQCAEAKIEAWSVQQRESNYGIYVHYTFSVKGVVCEGEGFVQGCQFPNPWVAKSVMERLQNKHVDLRVWYNPKDCSKNVVEKSFPWKDCVYFMILVGIYVYFIFLRRYVELGKVG